MGKRACYVGERVKPFANAVTTICEYLKACWFGFTTVAQAQDNILGKAGVTGWDSARVFKSRHNQRVQPVLPSLHPSRVAFLSRFDGFVPEHLGDFLKRHPLLQ